LKKKPGLLNSLQKENKRFSMSWWKLIAEIIVMLVLAVIIALLIARIIR